MNLTAIRPNRGLAPPAQSVSPPPYARVSVRVPCGGVERFSEAPVLWACVVGLRSLRANARVAYMAHTWRKLARTLRHIVERLWGCLIQRLRQSGVRSSALERRMRLEQD